MRGYPFDKKRGGVCIALYYISQRRCGARPDAQQQALFCWKAGKTKRDGQTPVSQREL
ncbi:hypothetical protein HMPREF9436_02314 [Faecalibacterium cf. prausnitzii KLE1255]|uniref:Uncharacterized protein n=1 Tax=Faecalibacterium cf. prausnitzii KLE1255 TaxID=748224 RepID=E2ZKW0_9FIRM|nr:hypothetical protein HMPREF9436_02314 [Faecalibacterium cf. prausnitzii KLE1255]